MSGLFRGQDPRQGQRVERQEGVLWWEIHRAAHHRPAYLLLENVDRLSPVPTSVTWP